MWKVITLFQPFATITKMNIFFTSKTWMSVSIYKKRMFCGRNKMELLNLLNNFFDEKKGIFLFDQKSCKSSTETSFQPSLSSNHGMPCEIKMKVEKLEWVCFQHRSEWKGLQLHWLCEKRLSFSWSKLWPALFGRFHRYRSFVWAFFPLVQTSSVSNSHDSIALYVPFPQANIFGCVSNIIGLFCYLTGSGPSDTLKKNCYEAWLHTINQLSFYLSQLIEWNKSLGGLNQPPHFPQPPSPRPLFDEGCGLLAKHFTSIKLSQQIKWLVLQTTYSLPFHLLLANAHLAENLFLSSKTDIAPFDGKTNPGSLFANMCCCFCKEHKNQP